MGNDKAIDKGTVDSGAPLNDDVDLNNIDMLPDKHLNDSTVVTEVLSSGRAGPVPGACEVFLDVDASLEAGLFSPDGEISECSLNDAQILPSSSEVLESQSILLGVSDVSGGTGRTREVDASSLDGDALNGAGGGQPPAPPSGDAAFESSLRGLRSRGKAKSSALRSLSRLKDRVAPGVLNKSSRKPSHIPKPAVATVTPPGHSSPFPPFSMNFLSLNVCGIRDANKRMSLMQWFSHSRLDIFCLQETHAVSASESSAWFSPYGFLTVSAVGSARARGLAILYRPRLILNQS